jgi:hypothetical protein
MEVIIRPTADKAARLVARLMANDLAAHPMLVLGLATGRTMERVYRQLVEIHETEDLDFSSCRTFNLDEYVGLAPDDRTHTSHGRASVHRVNIDRRNASAERPGAGSRRGMPRLRSRHPRGRRHRRAGARRGAVGPHRVQRAVVRAAIADAVKACARP